MGDFTQMLSQVEILSSENDHLTNEIQDLKVMNKSLIDRNQHLAAKYPEMETKLDEYEK